jgi:hypothetical protein
MSNIMELDYETLEMILKKQTDPSKISAFTRTSTENHRIYNHGITDYIAPTKHTLNKAIMYGATDTAIFSLINQLAPDEVDCKKSLSPLHYAVRYNASMNVINYLINKYTDLTKCRDQHCNMPIHIVMGGLSRMYHRIPEDQKIVQMLNALLDAFPGSIYALNNSVIGFVTFHNVRMTPLHIGIYSEACFDVIKTLITRDADVVKKESRHPLLEENEDVVLPVHLAAYYNSDFPIVKLLIEKFPESIAIQDKTCRQTPLHWALFGHYNYGVFPRNNKDNIKTITYLLKTCPIVTTFIDIEGDLPVDLECRRHEKHSQKYVNPVILITLMRMYLNNAYPDANGIVDWEADTIKLKKNIQLHLTTESGHHQLEKDMVLSLIEEIELHEKNIKNDVRDRNIMEVLIRFEMYKPV